MKASTASRSVSARFSTRTVLDCLSSLSFAGDSLGIDGGCNDKDDISDDNADTEVNDSGASDCDCPQEVGESEAESSVVVTVNDVVGVVGDTIFDALSVGVDSGDGEGGNIDNRPGLELLVSVGPNIEGEVDAIEGVCPKSPVIGLDLSSVDGNGLDS